MLYGASPGIADLGPDVNAVGSEPNGDLEIVIGSNDGRVYFIDGDENNNGVIDPSEVTNYQTGEPVHSSPAIGDVDGDGDLEVIIGSNDGRVYSFDYDPASNTVMLNWEYQTGGPV